MCEIAAVNFKAKFQGQTLDMNYIAKYAPEGSKGDFIKEVIFLMACRKFVNEVESLFLGF